MSYDRYWVEKARLNATGSTLEKIEDIASTLESLANDNRTDEVQIYEECLQKIATGVSFDTAERWLNRTIKNLD